jgi:hypothetical protein
VRRVEPAEGERGAVTARVWCRADGDCRPDIYRCIKSEDWVLLALQQEGRNLETVFRELTQEN